MYICNLKLTFPEYWREVLGILLWLHKCWAFLLCLTRLILHYTNLPFFGLMCSNRSTLMWICFVFCERKKTRIKWFPVDPITSSRTAEISTSGINYRIIWILSVAEQWDILLQFSSRTQENAVMRQRNTNTRQRNPSESTQLVYACSFFLGWEIIWMCKCFELR